MESEPTSPALAMVTHESEKELRRNLPGHVATAERLGSSLVIVDNGSGDGTRQLLRSWQNRSTRLELIELDSNRGYAAAVNVALECTGPRDVMVCNPDVELGDPAAVQALAGLLIERPRTGLVAPRLIGREGDVQPSARRLASLPAMLGSLRASAALPPLRRAYERYLSPSFSDDTISVGWVVGAAMLIRRRAYDEVGGFDQSFFLYMEDADFCRRLNRSGWSVDYVPAIQLRHDYARASSAAGATIFGSVARRRHVASLARYWRKHPRALLGGDL
jgi:N-acetylglucosaminyl-diphospho-decaprenol L-rhamnosyltransferase